MTAQSQVKASPQIVNGVNVTAMAETIDAVKANAEIAKFRFRLTNEWLGGDVNCSSIRDFTGACAERRVEGSGFTAFNGEHPVLLGGDKAPNPVEWLLHSLVGCMTTTLAYHAASRGIEIDAIESSLEGDLDLRGFLGLSADVRKGYSNIRVRMTVKSNASPTVLKALTQMSPVLDVVSKSVPVDVTIATR